MQNDMKPAHKRLSPVHQLIVVKRFVFSSDWIHIACVKRACSRITFVDFDELAHSVDNEIIMLILDGFQYFSC